MGDVQSKIYTKSNPQSAACYCLVACSLGCLVILLCAFSVLSSEHARGQKNNTQLWFIICVGVKRDKRTFTR